MAKRARKTKVSFEAVVVKEEEEEEVVVKKEVVEEEEEVVEQCKKAERTIIITNFPRAIVVLKKIEEEVVKQYARCESDESEDDASFIDSRAEMFLNEVDVTLDHHLVESSDEEWVPSTSQQPEKRFKPSDSPNSESFSALNRFCQPVRGSSKKKSRKTQSSPVVSPNAPGQKWNNSTDEDITPQPAVFRPFRTPGPQLSPTASYTVLQLFQLFLSPSMLQTIVRNTNAYGAKLQKGKKTWNDISLNDLNSYLMLVIFMGLVKVRSLTDYWRKSNIFKIPFPAQVMSARKFLTISSALHLSDPEVDAENCKKQGTAAYDRLCKIKPMYQQLRDACKNYFHPFQNIAIVEWMVATKARNGLKQYMKSKPTLWGYKLFVLADSRCAYMWDFFIDEGKSPAALIPQDNEPVMAPVDVQRLGKGYKLFVDDFYTSPALFRDLLKKNIGACGTIRSNRVRYPKTTTNKLPKKAPRGTHRWLREENLLFVEWKDTREVQMCSTIHRGTGGSTVQRKVKDCNGQWTTLDVPVPDCVLDYNRESADTGSDQDWEPNSKKPHTEGDNDQSLSGEEPPPSSPSESGSACRRPMSGRKRGRTGGSNSQAETSTCTSDKRWNDVDVPDVTPPQPTFRPTKSPGPQLIRTATYTVLQLFQLFFTNSMLQTIIKNTNDYGSAQHSNPWTHVTSQDMYAFMAMIIYMGLVKLPAMSDYWRGSKMYSLPFPKKLLTRNKFFQICRSLHLSSMVDDAANEKRRGTAQFDGLCKIKPLYTEMREACKRNYHPGQEISIDERMVASKARTGIKQYVKNKPVRWGYKLFVLADSSNGYSWDFCVYEGKVQGDHGKGLGYKTVMELVNTQMLGTGYKLYVDHFYTSPSLFCNLLKKRIWACGTVCLNKSGFPKTKINSLDSKSPRGSIRWIRKDSTLFLQWRDTRDVLLCSTLHTAHAGETIKRRFRDADGNWVYKDISVPPAVKEYNRCMGGVDLSDALINYYKVIQKTRKWYKTFFYHFLDIAIVNAFLLYKSITRGKGEVPMPQKAFREKLIEELAATEGRPDPSPAPRKARHHKPLYLCGDRSVGRVRCRHCHKKTPVKCSSCDVPLCFQLNRDCYNDWHDANNL